MHEGPLVFSQVTDHLPLHTFRRSVQRYQGERYVKQFRCLDQYLVMAFAQFTSRDSLRDIEDPSEPFDAILPDFLQCDLNPLHWSLGIIRVSDR